MSELVEWREQIDRRLSELEICNSAMVDAIAGKETLGGFRVGGLTQDMAWVKDQLKNGGLSAKLRAKDRMALWAAVIAAFGVIIAAALGAFA